jgi:hypothetical protein
MGSIIVKEGVFDVKIASGTADRSSFGRNVGGEITIFDNGGPAVA